MTSIYDTYKTNPKLELEGIVFDCGPDGKFMLARAGGSNVRFAKNLSAKMRPHERQMDAGTMDNEVGLKLLIEVFANSIVLGWEGVKDEKGKDLPFSVENCIKLFNDLPDLFTDVREQAMKWSNYRKQEIEDAVKN